MDNYIEQIPSILEPDIQESQEEFEKADKIVQAKLKKVREMNSKLDSNKLEGVYPFCYFQIAIANSKSGKTFSKFKILSEPKYKILDRILSGRDIYILSPTAKLDDSMGLILNLLQNRYKDFDDDQVFIDIENGVQAVNNRLKEQLALRQAGREIPYLLILIDDAIVQFKTKYLQQLLLLLSTQGRHFRCNTWISTQSYRQLSPIIRRNATHFSISNINLQSELDTISQELRTSQISQKEMSRLIQKITNEDYSYLLVCQLRRNEEKYLINGQEIMLL